jgi:hypothetical protein
MKIGSLRSHKTGIMLSPYVLFASLDEAEKGGE